MRIAVQGNSTGRVWTTEGILGTLVGACGDHRIRLSSFPPSDDFVASPDRAAKPAKQGATSAGNEVDSPNRCHCHRI